MLRFIAGLLNKTIPRISNLQSLVREFSRRLSRYELAERKNQRLCILPRASLFRVPQQRELENAGTLPDWILAETFLLFRDPRPDRDDSVRRGSGATLPNSSALA